MPPGNLRKGRLLFPFKVLSGWHTTYYGISPGTALAEGVWEVTYWCVVRRCGWGCGGVGC